jgi:hypothetical protein
VPDVTVKATPLLTAPSKFTTMLPLVASAGTVTIMLLAPQLVGGAGVPLSVTMLFP